MIPKTEIFALVFFQTVACLYATEPNGSGSWQDGFRLALPGYHYTFPRDYAAHPEFRTEWWYFTGQLFLADAENKFLSSTPSFGYELTFFRSAIQPMAKTRSSAWSLRDAYFAHFAVSDFREKKFWFTEEISRGVLGLAGAETEQLRVWINNWSLDTKKGVWKLRARQDDRAIELNLQPVKPPVIHGKDGVSQKAEKLGRATHYVSITRMNSAGYLTVANRRFRVAGESWFDREFGSNQLEENQVGWDWFSIQFSSGEDLMIYLIRKSNGCFEPQSSGSWVDAMGNVSHLSLSDISVLSTATWKSPKSGVTYPSRWEVRVPRFDVNVRINPLLPDQELVVRETVNTTYWEGACQVTGTHSGRAYVELTGYD